MSTQLPGDPSLVSTPEEIQALIQAGTSEGDIPVEDFFRVPERSNYQISPDGQYFSFLAPYKRRKNIFVAPLGSEKFYRITSFEDRNIDAYAWANNHDIVFLKDSGGDENFHLWKTNIESKQEIDVTPFDGVRVDIIDMLVDDDEHIIIGMNKENPQVFDPYKLNLNSGELKRLAHNEDVAAPIMSWLTDHQGKLRMATKLEDGVNTLLLYRSSESEDFKTIIKTNYKTEVRPLFFDFKEEHVVWCASNLNRDKSALVRINALTGNEIGPPIFEHPLVDIGMAGFSRKRKLVTLVSYTTDKRHYHFLDDTRRDLQQRLESELKGMEVVIVSSNKAEDKCIVRVYSDRSLGSYYSYDAQSDALVKISDVSPWIQEDKMASQKPISYQSRDGLTIYGYLTLPNDYHGGKIPIIVNPHGGPWHRDTWGFNPEIQLFANRGYGVLQMNFRGSTGYGRDFWECSFKQWGQAMQDDITDGVHWLIKEGIADPARIAIYGGSYGGYATLAGVCYTPDLYACAMDYVGVSNLFTFMKTVPPYWEPYLTMMYEMVGHPEEDQEMMTAYSPALNANLIKAPLFVIQGANDPRVNIDESDQIVRTLKARNIDVPYMVKYDEGHGFRNEENQFEAYKAMLGFLSTHL